MTGQRFTPLPKLSAPAQRALMSAGIRDLQGLAAFSEQDVRRLHGIGPNTLTVLRAALVEHGLSFKRTSAAQVVTDLKLIFSSLKGALEAYRPPFVAKVDNERSFDLWSVRPLVIEGRKRSEVFFASAVIQKDYVGFYYMPVYGYPEMKQLFPPDLLALLKGKSCFHVKKLDKQLLSQVRQVLKDGYKLYRSRKWI